MITHHKYFKLLIYTIFSSYHLRFNIKLMQKIIKNKMCKNHKNYDNCSFFNGLTNKSSIPALIHAALVLGSPSYNNIINYIYLH